MIRHVHCAPDVRLVERARRDVLAVLPNPVRLPTKVAVYVEAIRKMRESISAEARRD